MLELLGQTTQPSRYSPEAITALVTSLIALIGALKAWWDSGHAKANTQQLADNTAMLNRVVDKNDPLVTVPPDITAKTAMIGTGTGTGGTSTQ
jgi:hypothetical protein